MAETPERIAIIGCGLIGESWSALFTAHGHDVAVWDPAPRVLALFSSGSKSRTFACVPSMCKERSGRDGSVT